MKAGVVTTSGRPIPAALQDKSAYLMSPGGAYGPSFLVTDNFKVLRAYNTSDLYAVFVGHLERSDRRRRGLRHAVEADRAARPTATSRRSSGG